MFYSSFTPFSLFAVIPKASEAKAGGNVYANEVSREWGEDRGQFLGGFKRLIPMLRWDLGAGAWDAFLDVYIYIHVWDTKSLHNHKNTLQNHTKSLHNHTEALQHHTKSIQHHTTSLQNHTKSLTAAGKP